MLKMKMPCGITCTLALAIIVSKMIMLFSVENDPQIRKYKSQFSPELQAAYKHIEAERFRIYMQGYVLGISLSILFLFYNIRIVKHPMSAISMVCLAITITFFVNYFYYTLSHKTDWALNHVSGEKDVKAWLSVYRAMQFHYHSAFAIGLVAVGVLAFAFRGSCD